MRYEPTYVRMALYKIGILLFNLVSYIALRLVGRADANRPDTIESPAATVYDQDLCFGCQGCPDPSKK